MEWGMIIGVAVRARSCDKSCYNSSWQLSDVTCLEWLGHALLWGEQEWGAGSGSCLQLGFSQHRSAVCPLRAGSEIRCIGDRWCPVWLLTVQESCPLDGRQRQREALLSNPSIPTLWQTPSLCFPTPVPTSSYRKDVTCDDENVTAAAPAPESGCSQGWHHEVMAFRGQGHGPGAGGVSGGCGVGPSGSWESGHTLLDFCVIPTTSTTALCLSECPLQSGHRHMFSGFTWKWELISNEVWGYALRKGLLLSGASYGGSSKEIEILSISFLFYSSIFFEVLCINTMQGVCGLGSGGWIHEQQRGLAAVTKVAVTAPDSSLTSHIWGDLSKQGSLSRTMRKSWAL